MNENDVDILIYKYLIVVVFIGLSYGVQGYNYVFNKFENFFLKFLFGGVFSLQQFYNSIELYFKFFYSYV